VGLARRLFCGRDTGEGQLAGAVGRAEEERAGPEDGGWAMGAVNAVEERVIGALGGDEVPVNPVAPNMADIDRVICCPPGLMGPLPSSAGLLMLVSVAQQQRTKLDPT
jgi:hypothetical protein